MVISLQAARRGFIQALQRWLYPHRTLVYVLLNLLHELQESH